MCTPNSQDVGNTSCSLRNHFQHLLAFVQQMIYILSTNLLDWNCQIPAFDEVKFEAASMLVRVHEQKGQLQQAKELLLTAISKSKQSAYWHCRMLFQLAQIHAQERDFVAACERLGEGAGYAAQAGAHYTRALFMLSKGMLLLVDKKWTEAHPVLSECSQLVEAYNESCSNKESLKVFLLGFTSLPLPHGWSVQCNVVSVKSVKSVLKQLQQSIQTLTMLQPEEESVCSNAADRFQWIPKEHMCVLVYLVTVMHSMQAGYMDKAQKYTDKALAQIEKLKILDGHPILYTFQLMLLEHIIMCRLVVGEKSMAVQEIAQACQVCSQNPRLFKLHRAQLHTLLGLYSMSMNCMESAETQFNTALVYTQQEELYQFIALNLAIVYLRSGNRSQELLTLLEKINPETTTITSHSLKAAGFFVLGLRTFFQAKYNEAKRYLRETLKMSNDEDLNRLTACSLVLLGHIFLSLGNSGESMNMVMPAMQLAKKIPDMHVQLWGSALLRDLYHMAGDPTKENEGYHLHSTFSQQLLKDHFQSSQLPQHNLIQWTEGSIPPQHLRSNSANNSNGASSSYMSHPQTDLSRQPFS
ncbi:putative MAU2 chromatid cohesion factor-like isoform X1 [Apostichopus japonicus]|uniref:MAU2 chromatid cohesion factor homolog n=1 Tax=Stichopus japonicus TaxID=307972 RepID=A0A2G8L235_STIJA|nr:putative MAU2 chromatid cohesion factor-like isoform X1 [Apostichopus japonicus]